MPSVLGHCWLGIRKNIWPVNFDLYGVNMVICLVQDAMLHDVTTASGVQTVAYGMPLSSQNP